MRMQTCPSMNDDKAPTAAVLLIGNEVLSGRTKDKNLGFIADYLTALGIDLMEARVVADDEAAIVEAVNALRARYTYVFTTGGIGPTHDDITADCIASGFWRRYFASPGGDGHSAKPSSRKWAANPMRPACAWPAFRQGATLIYNTVSKAPGFRIGNVHVMAGVPKVMQAMMDEIAPTLTRGMPVASRTIRFEGGEGDIAKPLKEVQEQYPMLSIGSYPFESERGFNTNLVLRGRDEAALAAATEAVKVAVEELTKAGKARGWAEV